MTANESSSGEQSPSVCWCCGETRHEHELVRLGCHDEIAVCDGCIGWLGEQRTAGAVRRAIPILATSDVPRALRHYRALGFDTEAREGGGYGFLSRDGVELHIGQIADLADADNTVSAYLFVADADELYAEWSAASVDGEMEAPMDTDYGLREGRHIDPDGNVIRFGSQLAGSRDGVLLAGDDPVALAATDAVQTGDLARLEHLLGERPELATARIGDVTMSRTLLHAATDWPGHYPNVAAVIAALVGAGADVNARFAGSHAETPLHWAASSNDVEAVDALLEAGADIEAPGAVLGGGPPLADAVGFGQWQAARRLVERGATTRLKDAAALGLIDRVRSVFEEAAPPEELVTAAFWSACHGGQQETADYLLNRGADINWVGWDDLTPLDVASQADAGDLVNWLRAHGAKTANELTG
jgi:uncharacterized protein